MEDDEIFGDIGEVHQKINDFREEIRRITGNFAFSKDPEADFKRISDLERYISHWESKIYKMNHPTPPTSPSPPKPPTPPITSNPPTNPASAVDLA